MRRRRYPGFVARIAALLSSCVFTCAAISCAAPTSPGCHATRHGDGRSRPARDDRRCHPTRYSDGGPGPRDEGGAENLIPGQPARVDPTQPTPVPPVKKEPGGGGELVVAPIPKYDPSQEFSLILIGQYLFHPDPKDKVSPPSIIALGGMYTQQESYALFGGFLGYLDEDRLRVQFRMAGGEFNYNYYGIGTDAAQHDVAVELTTKFEGVNVQVTPQVFPDFYLGPRVQVAHLETSFRSDDPTFPVPVNEFDVTTVSLGLKVQYDTRDNTLYPTTGTLVDGQIDVFGRSLGSDFDYQSYELAFNQYIPVAYRSVLALRAYGKLTAGDVPFFALATFGTGPDLRGYEAGKYRDKMMFDVQAEYRYLVNDWLGVAAFAGIGEVVPDINSINADDLLWSAGVGLRFRLAKENPVYFRADLADGRDGIALYFSIGQAF